MCIPPDLRLSLHPVRFPAGIESCPVFKSGGGKLVISGMVSLVWPTCLPGLLST